MLKRLMAKIDKYDLLAIGKLLRATIDEVFERKAIPIKQVVSHLPTIDEFYSMMDEVMGEIKRELV